MSTIQIWSLNRNYTFYLPTSKSAWKWSSALSKQLLASANSKIIWASEKTRTKLWIKLVHLVKDFDIFEWVFSRKHVDARCSHFLYATQTISYSWEINPLISAISVCKCIRGVAPASLQELRVVLSSSSSYLRLLLPRCMKLFMQRGNGRGPFK